MVQLSAPRDAKGSLDYEGVTTLLQAAQASGSSPPESIPESEEGRPGRPLSRSARGDSDTADASPSRNNEKFGPRPPRPTYTQEQEDAIRFHRDDLSMTWVQVEEAYNGLYYADGTPWEKRTISGLQSRYYRLLPIPVNASKKQAKPRPELGILITNPERRYWWMSTSEMTPEERQKNSTYDSRNEYYSHTEEGDESDSYDSLRVTKSVTRKRKRSTPKTAPTSAPSRSTGWGSLGTKRRKAIKGKSGDKRANQRGDGFEQNNLAPHGPGHHNESHDEDDNDDAEIEEDDSAVEVAKVVEPSSRPSSAGTTGISVRTPSGFTSINKHNPSSSR